MNKVFVLVIGMVMFCLVAIPGEIWAYEPSDFLKNNFPELVSAYAVPTGSIPTDLSRFPRVRQWLDSRTITDTQGNYYGVDLTQFPPAAREWIMNTAFSQERMEGPSRVDPKLETWWSDDNNSIRFRATYIIAPRYANAGTLRTWGEAANYPGSSTIWNRYGDHARYHTLRFRWELTQLVEHLLRSDPMFAEIIEFAMQLSEEIEYDWVSFGRGYENIRRTLGKRYARCEGYTDEVMEKALRLNSVQSVQYWSNPGHTWNVLNLIDGRTLHFDVTWFDNETVDTANRRVRQTDDYDWADITFYEELFRFSGIGLGAQAFHHNLGQFVREVRR